MKIVKIHPTRMARTKQVKQCLRGFSNTHDVIRDNHGSYVRHSMLPQIWKKFDFPSDWRVETPDLHNTNCPAFVPEESFAIYEYTLHIGLRFPIPPFASSFLKENHIVPNQLHPRSWAILMAFHSLCYLRNVKPSLPLFHCFFQLNKCPKRAGTFFIQKSQGVDSPFIDDISKPPIKFEYRWLVVFPPGSQ